jgi:hypothetical protein
MPTYLAKHGKTFGPYQPQEIQEMKLNGQFFEYEWLWDGTSPDWSRVPPPAPPPPPRSGGTNTQIPAPPQTQVPAPTPAPQPAAQNSQTAAAPAPSVATVQFPPRPEVSQPSVSTKPASSIQPIKTEVRKSDREFQAICHDFHRLLSGTATAVTSNGCRLVCAEKGTAPHLVPKSKVWMDLLDERTDRSVTIKVTLGDLKKDGDSWSYDVQWENNPLLS